MMVASCLRSLVNRLALRRPPDTRHKPRGSAWLFFLAIMAAALPTDATPYEVAVLYKESGETYRMIYDEILQGFSQFPMTRATPILLNDDTTPEEVDQRLREKQARAVITLGVRGYKVSKQLHSGLPVVVGAMVIAPNGITGVSLAGDPGEFLDQVRRLTPQVRRVFMVYSESNSGWLVRAAEIEARARNLELSAHVAADAREALRHYDRILAEARGETDAIWLPLDSIVPDDTLLPMVLEAAWKRHLVLFSNNPNHARMGVLFSLYPDHRAMGQHLAELTVERLQPNSHPRVAPARKMKLAVNQRTASHLGLDIPPGQWHTFDLVYPSR